MARLVGVDIPDNKRVVISLTYIFGIGLSRSKKILKDAGLDENLRVSELSDQQLSEIRSQIENYRVEGDLRTEKTLNIKRLMEIKSYTGIRHRRGLPVHGQTTKNNARTRKGPRKTVANKKK